MWVACISTPKLGRCGGMVPLEIFEIYNLRDCFCLFLRLLVVCANKYVYYNF